MVEKFDSIGLNDKFFSNTKKANKLKGNYKLMLKGTAHSDMCDDRIYLDTYMKAINDTTDPFKYDLFISITMAFLQEHDFLPVSYRIKKVEDVATH